MSNEIKKKGTPSFDTIDGATLMSTPLQPLRFVVESLISQGLHVLAGSPKVGKSWLALGDYNAEQKELNAAIPIKEARLEKLKASAANVEAFIEKAKRYADIPELTPELLRLFIERIEVGERSERYSHSAEQDIRIVYRDVGVMDKVEPIEIGEQEFEELTEPAENEQKTA